MIRMIASDIDGTLLDGCGRLSERTKKALDDAAVRKIHTVIATGRAFSALPETLKSLEALEYVITSNGSSIFRLSDGRRIAGWDMPEDTRDVSKDNFQKVSVSHRSFYSWQSLRAGGLLAAALKSLACRNLLYHMCRRPAYRQRILTG